jgi:hypothetical protein
MFCRGQHRKSVERGPPAASLQHAGNGSLSVPSCNVHWLFSSRERANFISNKVGNKMAANNKKPRHTLGCGNIKATLGES